METARIKVLIIEDDAVDRKMVERTLAQTELKFEIECAESVKEGLNLLGGKVYDVALVDHKLPDGTAHSILKGMQEKGLTSTPTIVLTAHPQKDLALSVLNEGAQDFLPKDGICSDNLERSIRYSIQRSKLFQELQLSKERELRERELRIFQQTGTESDTKTIPPVKESAFTFEKFVNSYQSLVTQSLEETNYKVNRKVEEQMRALAIELSELEASAKDVVQIHSTALTKASKSAQSGRVEDAINSEARVLLVQLMGYLCMEYRNKSIARK